MQPWNHRGRRKSPQASEERQPFYHREQERLQGKVLPFSLETSAAVTKPSDREPQGRWYEAAFHTVTAVVGVGVLGLPYAFSYLLWYGGITAIVISAVVSFYTSYLLAALHEDSSGRRYNRYKDLGVAVLGERAGFWCIVPFQFSVMVGLGITYTVTAGESLQAVLMPECGEQHMSGTAGSIEGHVSCAWGLRLWICAFGVCQLVLSQIQDFHGLWGVSLLGALMSALYSSIAFGASLAKGLGDASYSLREGSTADLVFGAFNSLGSIMFAYGGHAVLLEIQATLASPPSPLQSMLRGVLSAYVFVIGAYFPVAIAGYASFGNVVRSDVLLSVRDPSWLIAAANLMVVVHVGASFQVFSQPVFEIFEAALTARGSLLSRRAPVMRGVVRSLYVAIVTAVAVCLPFFADLMGLIGAIGFTPMTFIIPSVLWLTATKPQGFERWLNLGIIGLFTLCGVLALVGSVRNISMSVAGYRLGR